MKTDHLETLLVEEVPEALIMHQNGITMGYVLVIPRKVIAVRFDGNEVIQSSPEHFESFWLPILNVELAKPVAIWS